MAEQKYTPENLAPMFRKAAALRNEMLECGFTDNGGAIHSAERILDILGLRLNYPHLHLHSALCKYPGAEFSDAALVAYEQGEKVLVEHVAPLRDLTRRAIAFLATGATDQELSSFVQEHYRLVLLTKDETQRLNRINRSRMTNNRLSDIGIAVRRRSGIGSGSAS